MAVPAFWKTSLQDIDAMYYSAQRAENRNKIAMAALNLANTGKGGERLVAGAIEPAAQFSELLRPLADRRACRLQCFVRRAD